MFRLESYVEKQTYGDCAVLATLDVVVFLLLEQRAALEPQQSYFWELS